MKYRIEKSDGWWYLTSPSGFAIYAHKSWRTVVRLADFHLGIIGQKDIKR